MEKLAQLAEWFIDLKAYLLVNEPIAVEYFYRTSSWYHDPYFLYRASYHLLHNTYMYKMPFCKSPYGTIYLESRNQLIHPKYRIEKEDVEFLNTKLNTERHKTMYGLLNQQCFNSLFTTDYDLTEKIDPLKQAQEIYQKNIQAKLLAHSQLRKALQDQQKAQQLQAIRYQFLVHQDGHISDLKLVKNSEQEHLNQLVLDAIKQSAPFDPIPIGMRVQSLQIEDSLVEASKFE